MKFAIVFLLIVLAFNLTFFILWTVAGKQTTALIHGMLALVNAVCLGFAISVARS